MQYNIKSISTLRRILWLDASLGGSTAITGLCFSALLTPILGLQQRMILIISLVTLVYVIVAASLASRKHIPVTGVRILVYANWFWTFVSIVRILVYANWFWTFVSIVLLILCVKETTLLGALFLIAQIVAVGGLAYLEGRQVIRKNR
jgi:hypothetical protein